MVIGIIYLCMYHVAAAVYFYTLVNLVVISVNLTIAIIVRSAREEVRSEDVGRR